MTWTDLGWILLISIFVYTSYANGEKVDLLKEQAIAHECARYSPTTGEFEWLGAGDD